MSSLYFSDRIHLKTYGAVTKQGKSRITIELEVMDPYEVASVLRQLDEMDAEQKAQIKKPSARKARKHVLALPAPALGLPYYGEEE